MAAIIKSTRWGGRAVVVGMGGYREVQVAGYKLIVHEGDGVIDPCTGRALTGSWLWDSAVYLAEWMAACGGAQVAGATVLELGAGTGLPGLLAASMGAARVVLTDVGQLIGGLRASAAANGQEARVEVRELRWGEAAEAADVVLMSDVFFDAEEMEGLGRTMRAAWGPRTTGWAATDVRPGVGECLEALKREGFEATVVEESVRPLMRTAASPAPEEGEISMFALYQISRRLP